jgi:F-type H+-transporting ATPase subunit b
MSDSATPPILTPLIVAQDATGAADAAAGGAPASTAPASTAPASTTDTAAGTTPAGETHAGTAVDTGVVGMPQLDINTYAPQLVWLVISFLLLLVLMWAVALPRLTRIMAAREGRIAEDLDRAERMKKDADEAMAAYGRAMNTARANAQEELRTALDAAAAVAAERDAAFAATLKTRLDDAQRSIESAKAAAIGDLRTMAVEVAAAAAGKLGGGEMPTDRVAAAVDHVLARRSAGQKEA